MRALGVCGTDTTGTKIDWSALTAKCRYTRAQRTAEFERRQLRHVLLETDGLEVAGHRVEPCAELLVRYGVTRQKRCVLALRQPFEEAHHVVAQIPHRAAIEAGKALGAHHLLASQEGLEHIEGVALLKLKLLFLAAVSPAVALRQQLADRRRSPCYHDDCEF